ncbi:amidase [Arthrobacter sp. N1]|uniref:amidase n=1 Tax=Arthrobacter sp. N1 TaxID=619291 RepID=UPI003BB14D3B
MQPYELTLTEASARISSGELSPRELTESALTRIEAVEGRVHAFAAVTAEIALAQADRATAEIARGTYRGPLHGIPVGIKDLMNTAGTATTASSKVRAQFVPDADAAVVEAVGRAGMVMVGKTHTHEFAYGGVTPTTRNPWNLERMAGGSSGGSAAAVGYGGVLAALGSDTGGSIRIPASFCGTVGLKPTFGRVSRVGVASLAWSLDTVGPLTRNVSDAALVLNAIAGHDPRDPGSARTPVPDFTERLEDGVDGLRIGIPTNFFTEDLDGETDAAVAAAVRVLEGLGAVVVPVVIPQAEHLGAVITGIMMPEASAYHRRALRETPELFTEEVRSLLEVGETILATDYIDALRFRQSMKDAWKDMMRAVDVVVAPTVLTPALPAQDTERFRPDGTSEDANVEFGRLSIPANLLGLPSLQVPCGFSAAGLPLGVQIMGRPFAEQTVLAVGRAYELATDTVGRIAPL